MTEPSVLNWIVHLWPIILALVGLIGSAFVVHYKVDKALEWKRVLFRDDGSLNYVTRKEYEKNMATAEADNGLNLTEKRHEALCKIASLEIASKVGEIMDTKLTAFEDRLFKELRLNGYRKHSEV